MRFKPTFRLPLPLPLSRIALQQATEAVQPAATDVNQEGWLPPENPTAQPPDFPNREISHFRARLQRGDPLQTGAQRGFASQPSADVHPVHGILKRYVSIAYLERIVSTAEGAVDPRDPDAPVPREGLHAIAAYTSGSLDQQFSRLHSPVLGVLGGEREDLILLEQFIKNTVLSMKKTPAELVRRNTVIGAAELERYQKGFHVGFDRLTSVTLSENQVYHGGNVDFVIQTAGGVVAVNCLSEYEKQEVEGLLDPFARFEVKAVYNGRETDRPNRSGLDENKHPPCTICLQELAEVR